MSRDGREGFILVSVLGAMIVLAGLVGAVSYLVRTAVTGAAATRDELTIDALTRSGVEIAGYELFSLRRPAAAVNAQQIRMNDGVLTLFVSSEAGKIDLNGAPPELLAGAWASIGAPGMQPEAFAARVADYRDADGDKTPHGGAEAGDYAAASPNLVIANAPFETVDELQNVLGVTPDAVRSLAPLLTVQNPSGKLSVMDVPAAVMRAVPGGSAAFDKIRAIRLQPPADLEQAMQKALGEGAKYFSTDASVAYRVRVEVRRGDDVFRATTVTLTASRASEALYFTTGWDVRPTS
ncbi:MAG: hypothetical protein ABW275_09295 [Hansschlegelia sp.]